VNDGKWQNGRPGKRERKRAGKKVGHPLHHFPGKTFCEVNLSCGSHVSIQESL